MKSDRFWETFWLSFFAFAIISVGGSAVLFINHIHGINAAAVGISYDPNKDPFESGLVTTKGGLIEGFAYKNSLPLGLSQWSWDATVDWTSSLKVYEGSASVKINFAKEWSGIGMNGFSVSPQSARSLTLAVYPDEQVGTLYLELYDQKNNSLRRQSLGWYTPSGELTPNTWNYVAIPLENLYGEVVPSKVTGIAISTKNPGVAFVDAIRFDTTAVVHEPWVLRSVDLPPFNPFATSTPLSLPYKASFDPEDFTRWYSYYGYFGRMDGAFIVGPKAPNNTDAVAVFRGGRFWSDYEVKTTLDWGITSVFSLLVRVTDASNFASCAYSYYGQTVQIYQVLNGVSTQLAQSPALPTKYEDAWKDVHVGAAVQGDRVSCFLDGERVLSAVIPGLPARGTIGFEAWDKTPESSPHTIHAVEVRPLLGE